MDENVYFKQMMHTNTNTASDGDDSCSVPSFSWFPENIKRRKSRLGTHRKQIRVFKDLVINNKDYSPNGGNNGSQQFLNKVSPFSSLTEGVENRVSPVKLKVNKFNLVSPVTQSDNVSAFIRQTDNLKNNILPVTTGDTFHYGNEVSPLGSSTDNLRNDVTPFIFSVPELDYHISPFPSPEDKLKDNISPVIPPESRVKPPSPPSIQNNLVSPKPVVHFAEPAAVLQKCESFQNTAKIPSQIIVKGKSYKVLNLLGSGGSSMVYQVLHPETNESLAVKRVKLSQADEDVAKGYLNEVQMLESLQKCDVIIKIFDHQLIYENDKKFLYVVMEKGDIDLSQLIRNVNSNNKLSIPMIVYYWSEMLSAVNEIHNRGIIHSDLKPANFLLVRGRLKLIDFGIASSMQADMTSVYKDVFCGTLNYMSPEAVNCVKCPSGSAGYKITFKTDVWSLGCILYNLIYGRLPFQHIKKKWDKLSAIVSPDVYVEFPDKNDIPPALLDSLKSCLEKDPKKRPSVSELLDHILRMFQESNIQ